MDISELNGILVTVDKSVSVLYIGLLVLAFMANKRINSTSIAFFILCLGQGMDSLAFPHLVEIASSSNQINLFAWYGGWMTLNLISLALLLKFHQVFRLRVSNVSLAVAFSLAALSVIHAIDFIDVATINSGFFAAIYQVSIPLISILIIPVTIMLGWYEYNQRRPQIPIQGV